MNKEIHKKWWVWVIAIAVIALSGWYILQWYRTRINPFTPQASGWNCPNNKPIKGNAQSGIYHIPSGKYYSRTKPERCFANESDAQKAGFRKSSK